MRSCMLRNPLRRFMDSSEPPKNASVEHHDDDDERSRAKRLALQVLQRQSFESDSCDHRLTGLESR